MASKNQRPIEYDVLIVGAGPTGLALGMQLARYGVSFQIIDKAEGFKNDSRSIAIQGTTLESLLDLGIAEGLLQLGTAIRKVKTYIDGEPSFEMSFRNSQSPLFPFILSVEQSKLERVLAGALFQKGQNIGWGAELKSFKQYDDHVESIIFQQGHNVQISTKWIVGCDGGDSTVREILGIPMQGNNYEEKFILADLSLDWGLNTGDGYVFLHPSDILAVFPLPGGTYRVITTQKGIADNEPINIRHLVQKFKELCPVAGSLAVPTWITGYGVKRSIASQMRMRRAFLAGDAAHIHSPLGGQGLNTGIDDGLNLGWKLGLYCNECVGEAYLDSYEGERLKVAKANLAHTNLATSIVMTRSKIGQLLRDLIAPLILNYPAAQRQLERIIGDNRISYDANKVNAVGRNEEQLLAGKIKESFFGGVTVGDRLPNFDLQMPKDYKRFQLLRLLQTHKHVLLYFLGEKSKEFKQHYENFSHIKNSYLNLADSYFIVGEHAIDYTSFDPNLTDAFIDPDGRGHELYKCIEPTLYLIRPDGYVCYKGAPLFDPLKGYVSSHFNMDKINNLAEKAQGDSVKVKV